MTPMEGFDLSVPGEYIILYINYTKSAYCLSNHNPAWYLYGWGLSDRSSAPEASNTLPTRPKRWFIDEYLKTSWGYHFPD